MSNTNDFVPFCATDTGTNLLSQSAYLVTADRPIGNQPGVASSNLVNKALRQPTYVVSQLAQYISNFANVSVLDNATPAQLLGQIMSAFQPLAPVVTPLLSGSGTWNATFNFFIAAGNATAGATYTNNGVTYTVKSTITAGLILQTTGNGPPTAGGGTLTKASGTGDSAIAFYGYRNALFLKVRMVGAGGGGGGGSNGGNGTDGTATTFGTTLLVASPGTAGGGGATSAGNGGAASLGTGPVGLAISGGKGQAGTDLSGSGIMIGGNGGNSFFGGAAGGGNYNDSVNASPNSGGGGAGGGTDSTNVSAGAGGGGGGFVDATIFNPSSTYSYSIGVGGTGGTAGSITNTTAGSDGGSGLIITEEHFQ